MIPEKYHLETRYYYTCLNSSEKPFYEFVVEKLLNHELKFFFVFTEEEIPKDDFHQSLPRFYPNFQNYIDISKVITAVDDDWPEFYYIDFNNYIFTLDGYIAFNEDKDIYTREEIDSYNDQIEELINKFSHISDDFELELAIHDYVVKQYSYDYEAVERDKAEIAKWEAFMEEHKKATEAGLPTDHITYERSPFYDQAESYEPFSVIGLLKKNMGVCEAYTDVAQLILQRRGVPCAHIVGNAGSEGDQDLHAWLAVKIKGHYYHLDITFNDSYDNDSRVYNYTYFNVTDDEIRVNHEFEHEKYPGIVCDHTEYNYYNHFKACFNSYEEIKERFLEIVEKRKNSGKAICYCFKCTAPLNPTEVERTVGSIIYRYVKDYDGYLFNDCYYSFYMIFKDPEISDTPNDKTN